jgi:hypothetical protein
MAPRAGRTSSPRESPVRRRGEGVGVPARVRPGGGLAPSKASAASIRFAWEAQGLVIVTRRCDIPDPVGSLNVQLAVCDLAKARGLNLNPRRDLLTFVAHVGGRGPGCDTCPFARLRPFVRLRPLDLVEGNSTVGRLRNPPTVEFPTSRMRPLAPVRRAAVADPPQWELAPMDDSANQRWCGHRLPMRRIPGSPGRHHVWQSPRRPHRTVTLQP